MRRIIIPIAAIQLCLLLTIAVTAQDLGRLFTSPEERAALDASRNRPPPPAVPVAPEPTPVEAEEPPPPVSFVTVQGIVRRSRGPNTVWVNGENSTYGLAPEQGVRVDSSQAREGTVPVRVRNPRLDVGLKPGQTLDPATARVVDIYQRGTETPLDTATPASPQR
ncbi:MAG: hypothetical protein ACREWG_15695 [Gammaproteobacteria bacterium]